MTAPDRNPATASPSSPQDLSATLQSEVADAYREQRALQVIGGDTKGFYGRAHPDSDATLSLSRHCGIVAYEPTELVVTARAGTPITDIESELAKHAQFLPFEPPRFGRSTIGGAIAAGLAGPRRAYAGAPRDFLLGVRILNGRGDDLRFGGQVMKNVAGYDVSRLMAGAMGTLGVLLEVSLKVLPVARTERTLVWSLPANRALHMMREWALAPWPISATFHESDTLYVRLSGTESGVNAASAALGGSVADVGPLWDEIRDQRHPYFQGQTPLWRLALPEGTGVLELPGRWALEWGGTERWLRTDAGTGVREAATAQGGHATLFRGGSRTGEVFQPLSPELAVIHRQLKRAFDPAGILNPGRLYPDL